MDKALTRFSYTDLIDRVPQLKRGRVWCHECGRTERVDSAVCIATGWPKCCGFHDVDRQPGRAGGEGVMVPSAASDAVTAAEHPSPEAGGPCATCAFRPGTEANTTPHTVELARLCVEGFRHFYCHEQPRLCRGFIAALNLRGVPETDDDRKWAEIAGHAADILSDAIHLAVRA